MAEIDDLMKRHSVERAGAIYDMGLICCWVNREAPVIYFQDFGIPIPKEAVLIGRDGWRVGWAPTLPEAFMIALMSERLEAAQQT